MDDRQPVGLVLIEFADPFGGWGGDDSLSLAISGLLCAAGELNVFRASLLSM
jgi:hypothetical protein